MAGQPSLPPGVRAAITVCLASVVILGFFGIFGWSIYQTWSSSADKPKTYSEPFVYVSTGLAALIGGIVAVGFGQKPVAPVAPVAHENPLYTRSIAGLGRLMVPSAHVNWQTVLAVAYAIVYLGLGVAALITWVFRTQQTPDLIKNLGVTVLGMVLPIVAGFFNVPQH